MAAVQQPMQPPRQLPRGYRHGYMLETQATKGQPSRMVQTGGMGALIAPSKYEPPHMKYERTVQTQTRKQSRRTQSPPVKQPPPPPLRQPMGTQSSKSTSASTMSRPLPVPPQKGVFHLLPQAAGSQQAPEQALSLPFGAPAQTQTRTSPRASSTSARSATLQSATKTGPAGRQSGRGAAGQTSPQRKSASRRTPRRVSVAAAEGGPPPGSEGKFVYGYDAWTIPSYTPRGGRFGPIVPTTGPYAAQVGHLVSQPLRNRPKSSMRTFGRQRPPALQGLVPAGTPTGAAAIAQFVSEHPQCHVSQEQVAQLIDTVQHANWNGRDLAAAVRLAVLRDPEHVPYMPPGSKTARVAGMALADTTYGPEDLTGGHSQHLPTLLWAILDHECAGIPALTETLRAITSGELGALAQQLYYDLPTPLAPIPDDENAAVAYFVSKHPRCQQMDPNLEADIRTLLGLVDYYHASGADMDALVRTLGMEGVLSPEFPRTGWRAGRRPGTGGNLSVGPAVLGLRGSATQQFRRLKFALLWDVLQTYCAQLPEIIRYMNNVLAAGRTTGYQPGRYFAGKHTKRRRHTMRSHPAPPERMPMPAIGSPPTARQATSARGAERTGEALRFDGYAGPGLYAIGPS